MSFKIAFKGAGKEIRTKMSKDIDYALKSLSTPLKSPISKLAYLYLP